MPDDQQRYPEHAKLRAVKHDSQRIGEFLDWLLHHPTLVLAGCDDAGELYPAALTIEGILGEYLGIDPKGLSREKDEMVEEMRRANHERRR